MTFGEKIIKLRNTTIPVTWSFSSNTSLWRKFHLKTDPIWFLKFDKAFCLSLNSKSKFIVFGWKFRFCLLIIFPSPLGGFVNAKKIDFGLKFFAQSLTVEFLFLVTVCATNKIIIINHEISKIILTGEKKFCFCINSCFNRGWFIDLETKNYLGFIFVENFYARLHFRSEFLATETIFV